MRPNPQLPADLVTFNEEILNGKLHFLCSQCFKFSESVFLHHHVALTLLLFRVSSSNKELLFFSEKNLSQVTPGEFSINSFLLQPI